MGTPNFPFRMPLDVRRLRTTAGPNVATGFPRFVTVIVPPFCAISSSSDRHLALNSVALTNSLLINRD